MKQSKALARAVAKVNGSHVILGMGEVEDGKEFARKSRMDLNKFPLLVDAGPAFNTYAALDLRDMATLSKIYLETINLEAIFSAVRSLVDGQLPHYDRGGSLTQLGGTFVLNNNGDNDEPTVL